MMSDGRGEKIVAVEENFVRQNWAVGGGDVGALHFGSDLFCPADIQQLPKLTRQGCDI